ncbi:MAG: PrsW family intramembrane metalloprotease [Micromonosporaceae bacterium]
MPGEASPTPQPSPASQPSASPPSPSAQPASPPSAPPHQAAWAAQVAPVPGDGRGWRSVLALTGVIGGIALVGIGLLVFLGYRIGPMALAVGLVAAIVPVPILVGCFIWLDRYEPEPVRYLALAFAWGAAIATSVSLGVNTGSGWLFDRAGLPDWLVAVLVAPFIEELTKALGPLLLLLRRRREFSGITDGIVYCGLSATGFAMVENILYLGGYAYASGLEQYGPATAAQNLIALFIARIVLTGFAHPLFTAMSGIGLGIAARASNTWVRRLAPIAGLLVAMLLHGGWNLMATLTGLTGELLVFLYGYISIMVPVFLAMIGVAVWLRSWEGRLTERTLPVYVGAGWLSPPEVAALGTLGRRHSARRWARRVAGDAGVKAMRDYQYAATRLALLRDRMNRGLDRTPADRGASVYEEQVLLGTIVASRQAFTGRDPQVPPAHWDGSRYHVTFPDGVRRTVAAPPEPVVPIPVPLAPPRPPNIPPPGLDSGR